MMARLLVLLFWLNAVLNAHAEQPNSSSAALIRRDGSLEGLASLLNDRAVAILGSEARELVVEADPGDKGEPHAPGTPLSPDQANRMLAVLAQWLITPPAAPLNPAIPSPEVDVPPPVDCTDPRYSQILTGVPLKQPRPVVDFVAVGYDLDALEVRLVENYAVVDVFVLYESPRTQHGYAKPLFVREALLSTDRSRFERFLPKIVHFGASEADIAGFVESTAAAKKAHDAGQMYDGNALWALEKQQRTEVIRRFRKRLGGDQDLRARLGWGDGIGTGTSDMQPWGIQGDEDELITRNSLAHFRACELKTGVGRAGIYAPCFMFKSSYSWLMKHPGDMPCLAQATHLPGTTVRTTTELAAFYWRPGPWLWPLSQFLEHNSTLRSPPPRSPQGSSACQDHLGIGAAVHLSSVSEPAKWLYKQFGAIEGSARVPSELLAALRLRSVTTRLLFDVAVRPWCSFHYPLTHVSPSPEERADVASKHWEHTLGQSVPIGDQAVEVVKASLPRAVTSSPERYPFMVPGAVDQNGPNAAVRFTSELGFPKLCVRRQ
ncbi:hypothetical protein FOA52_007937 [Chlamydomonas sp. UWO 241]|nr:hypothetical protein FOA52_007937 [Chlamydomonas sp. UWO 241]